MNRGSLLLLLLLPASEAGAADSPHGPLSLDCAVCHTTLAWTFGVASAFDHDGDTSWPLEGGHDDLACVACHEDLRFRGTETSCLDCHLDLHGGGLGDDCADCHGPERWFDPERLRRRHDQGLFPLTGAHALLSCSRCHEGTGAAQFAGAPLACAACHLGSWRATTSPSHEASGLGTECAECHGTRRWTDTPGFAHAGFPLQGAHRAAPCASCHQGGVFQGTPTLCWTCHQTDYQAALNPDHVTGQYPQSCDQCHTATAWSPASFDHGLTTFPLTGAHIAVTCIACHESGQYAGTSAACQSCHLDSYQATTNPDHASAGFALDCAICHNTSGWAGATFEHDQLYFPINSGSHRNEWTSCVDCHTNPGSYADFSCLGCHEHNRTDMDDDHGDVGGYVYDSQACLQCHPDGRASDALPQGPLLRPMDTQPRRLLR